MKKIFHIFVLLLLLFTLWLLQGCSSFEETSSLSTDEKIELWVVSEKTVEDGMNQEIEQVLSQLKLDYPNITVNVDILPTEQQERAAYLKRIRNEIECGGGPDVFLLPTRSTLTLDQPEKYTYIQIDPLFSNVEVEMRNGTFFDFRKYFDKDQSIDKESLVTEVMDAGVVDSARYVLPLRYNMPVVYVFNEDAESKGMNLEDFEKGIDVWMDSAIALDDPMIACGAEYRSFNAFSNLIGYDSGEVNLDAKELETYLTTFQKIETLIGTEVRHRNQAWLSSYLTDSFKQFPVQISNLDCAMTYAAMAKLEGKTLSMFPVRTTDNDVVATISYYGAIGKNCKNPEAAYMFLRMFLEENVQWEIDRTGEDQYPGLIEQSWPVRSKGAVSALWNTQKKQVTSDYSSRINQKKRSEIATMDIKQEDISILNAKIDIVRFPLNPPNTFLNYVYRMNDFENKNKATSIDVMSLSEEIILNLKAELEK